PPPPPSGHAAETGLTVSPALSASPPPGCLSVGPFGDVDAAARAAALLRGKGFDPRQRRQAGDGSRERRVPGTLYWLDLVPPAGRAAQRERARYAPGVTPSGAMKLRGRLSGVPNPQRRAICCSGRSVCSSFCRAAVRRICLT